jgi:formylglycine-generating enzyme required for sulfatase activity
MVRGYWRLKAEMPGYEVAETATETFKKQNSPRWKSVLKISLDPQGSVPLGMAHIHGSEGTARRLDLGGLQNAGIVQLPGYFIDKYEVTNKQFRAFIENGGYREQKYWKYSFVHDGQALSWEEGMKLLVDKTGLPGPSTWELGDYPQGLDDYPVSGVSWYEAAA